MEDNIKMYLVEMGWGPDWNHLAQNRDNEYLGSIKF
jgi:hypothetical protein